MKKNLIVALALVFVLGIAGTAFAAANPFTDVPAKHWAYDAVSKLAQAGILDGYGDGTYRGERLASRYELAQATAKAMARADKADAQMKALIDKLAVEFAAELNNLGVRVAKLEKNASSIKFWGDARIRYQANYGGQFDVDGSKGLSRVDERLRVYAKADLNDKAQFFGRIMSNWNDTTAYNGSSETHLYWDYGYFQWTFDPSFKFAIGRQQIIGALNTFWTNGGYDAIMFKFGAPSDKFKATLGYGDVGSYSSGGGTLTNATTKPVLTADLNYAVNKDWTVNGSIYYSTNADKFTGFSPTAAMDIYGNVSGNYQTSYAGGYPFQVYAIGVKGNLNPDFNLLAQYFWNGASINAAYGANVLNDSKTGFVTELWYKGADFQKVGSWGLAVNYRDVKPFAIDMYNTSGFFGNAQGTANQIVYGFKGWGAQANYTISKNAMLTFTYESLSANNTNSWTTRNTTNYLPWYYLQMNVNF